MSLSIKQFPQIDSFEELAPLFLNQIDEEEQGVLALDLDQTLIEAKSIFGSEHFYQFLMKYNTLNGLDANAHYHWTVQLRQDIDYKSCEPVDKINSIIAKFRDRGWHVKILTSRGLGMREITQKHLKQSGIDLKISDVIFKQFYPDNSKKRMPKGVSLIKWMNEDPSWRTCDKSFQVLFLDDSIRYCHAVDSISETLPHAKVTCLHYTKALPNPDLTQRQLEQLAVEVNDYLKQKNLQRNHDEKDLDLIPNLLETTRLSEKKIYEKIVEISAFDGLPIMGLKN
ncbi:MAG: hypothetical protein S4CHLAM6_02340 [Chlamydiae bacterium]|nr:hypothetical protein [Chlamydiota bacterium]